MKAGTNNFIAGLFTLAGIVGFVFIVLTLAGVSTFATSKTKYIVRFNLVDGARGLKPGSDIAVGGQSVGEVKKVMYHNDAAGAPEAVDVTVAIRSGVVLYKDCVIYQIKPLLGDVSVLDIPRIGTPGAGKLNEGDVVIGAVAPPAFLAQAGYGDVQRNQLQQILERGSGVAEDLKKITASVSEKVDPTVKNINDSAADMRAIAAEAKTKLDEWSPKVNRTLDNAEKFTADIAGSRKLVDEGLEKFKKFVDDLQSLVRDNRPRIDNTIKNADELVAKANQELVDQVKSTLADAQRGLSEFGKAGERVNALLAEQTPEIRLSLANARLASDQLKLMMTEVRRNPWRLFYQPGKKELERELLYDAARDYASAVSDLRGASASLSGIVAAADKDHGVITREHLADIQKTMNDALGRYKQAEEKFLDLVVKQGP